MSTRVSKKIFTIALAGQPNTGKSTVFNRLTGSRQHVGNWPGKTVEQKSGVFEYNNFSCKIVDLPGTYSLTANSLEERIARDFLINDQPDVVVVMADASQLERTLYLLTEVRLLSVPVVLALNMMDVAHQQGKRIDVKALRETLGVPVVPMVAAKGTGVAELLSELDASFRTANAAPEALLDDLDCMGQYCEILPLLPESGDSRVPVEWTAIKLIEGDADTLEGVRGNVSPDLWKRIEEILRRIPDGALLVAGARYAWIQKAVSFSLRGTAPEKKKGRGKRFDKAATHQVWGKFIAVGVMILAFGAAMIVAMPLMTLIQMVLPALTSALRELFAGVSPWVGSLFADGLVPGLGVGLLMLFYIFGVYLAFGILEDVGYLARLAYVFDGSMSRIGLHGKSFMPLLMSFGCNIAGVTGTRVIDSWRQRMITLVLVSIIPCMALWGVVSLMGGIFFGAGMPLVILALLAVMILHVFLTSELLRKFMLKGEKTGLIMELPPYHKPNWRTIWGYVWVQVKAFLKRAVTLIALVTAVVWALSYQPDGNVENSVLASIGRFFDPLSGLMGLDWRLFIALAAAIIAKEASLSVLAVLYGVGRGPMAITGLVLAGGEFEHGALIGAIGSSIAPASALAFIFAFFFSIPCLGTVATIYSETKSLKWTIGSSLYYIFSSFVYGVLAYQVGRLIF
jgi:ferrous iron transport protein B